jgi:hypothetical protein
MYNNNSNEIMTWFKDSNRHILESKNKIHRLLYCPLCQKLISKADCQKLRQSSKTRNLYPVKRYYYYSKTQLAERGEEKERKRLLAVPKFELSKIVERVE